MIHHNLDLFCDIYKAKNEHNRRQTPYLSSVFPNDFGIFVNNHDSFVITFWLHCKLFIIIFEKIKLIALVNWIFRMSDFLRLFMISFKYGLILFRYFFNWYFHISPCSKGFLISLSNLSLITSLFRLNLTIFLISAYWKRFLISLSILPLIALFSFFSSKGFLISLIAVSLVSFHSFFQYKKIYYISTSTSSSSSSLELFVILYCEKK